MTRNRSRKKVQPTKWAIATSTVALLGEAAIASTVLSIFVSANPSYFNTIFSVNRSTQVKYAPPPHIIALGLPHQPRFLN